MLRSLFTPFLFLCLALSGCSFFGRFLLVNEHSSPIHVVGTITEGDSAALAQILWYVKNGQDDDEPHFRDTLIDDRRGLVAELATGDAIVLGGATNREQDSVYLAFSRLVITDTTGKYLILSSRSAIYARCSKETYLGWTSKLVYKGE
jgi:hypothetical protein